MLLYISNINSVCTFRYKWLCFKAQIYLLRNYYSWMKHKKKLLRNTQTQKWLFFPRNTYIPYQWAWNVKITCYRMSCKPHSTAKRSVAIAHLLRLIPNRCAVAFFYTNKNALLLSISNEPILDFFFTQTLNGFHFFLWFYSITARIIATEWLNAIQCVSMNNCYTELLCHMCQCVKITQSSEWREKHFNTISHWVNSIAQRSQSENFP